MRAMAWLAVLAGTGCFCDVHLPDQSSTCGRQGGSCQAPEAQCAGLTSPGLCNDSTEICCWPPAGSGGGNAGTGGGSATGGGAATGGGTAGSGDCGTNGGQCAPAVQCPGTTPYTQYSCGGDTVCCPPSQCDSTTVTAFVDAHKGCFTAADCKPLCMLGASCDERGVNQAGATDFASTFAGCHFGQCEIACFLPQCTAGQCAP